MFHVLWITHTGYAVGEAKGIHRMRWSKTARGGRSGAERLSGRLAQAAPWLFHLVPWICFHCSAWTPVYFAFTNNTKTSTQFANRQCFRHTYIESLDIHSAMSWVQMSYLKPQRCQEISPEFTRLISDRTGRGTQIFWLQTVCSASSLFWGYRSPSVSQSWPLTRAITGVHPLICLSIYFVIHKRLVQYNS